ncbi:MAG: aminotransferase class I/II-fold pyridoxal phosphate-dependent enzyme [Chloroflexia bacterium]|nr:aminotransferase class I/II-fold pyridoxal phosphate-dependent enzyme [Chloroflexia bacterium]
MRSSRLSSPAAVISRANPIRLDQLSNPFGPSPLVLDTLAADLAKPLDRATLFRTLLEQLTNVVGLPASSFFLANGAESILRSLYLTQRDVGPVILFPPSDPEDLRRADTLALETISISRGSTFRPTLDLELVAELPPTAMAVITTPNDPTGTVAGSQDVVRLARACRLVVIDERHGGYQAQSLLPLAREFDNVVVIQSFETWAGLAALPFAYAAGAPSIVRKLRDVSEPAEPSAAALIAARATLNDLIGVNSTVRRVRLERSRLYRMLRKLNVVTPYPSWCNFLLVRIERGTRSEIDRGLRDRGVSVHLPSHRELAGFIRVSATYPEETDALKSALIEISRDL